MKFLPIDSVSHRFALGALTLAALASVVPVQAQQGNLDSLANREVVRRQEDLVVADQLIVKADKAAEDKDYEAAYVNYIEALDRIPAGAATGEFRSKIVIKFSGVAILYAEKLISIGRYNEAERVAKTVLLPQYDPSSRQAVQLLSNLEQSDYYNKTITPQLTTDREEVTKLLYEGEGFFQSGRFDLALKRYEQVLDIDPYNIAARKGMEQVNNQKMRYYDNAQNETRSRMLWLVDRSWDRPVRHFQGGRSTGVDIATRGGVRGTEAITAKLNRIIIPKIDLRDTSVREAVEFLKQRSRELDTSAENPKDKRGVNIVLKLDGALQQAPVVDPTAPPPAEGAVVAPVGGNADTRITLALTNVPLVEALRYLTELASLKYKIEPFAVSIVPVTENTTDLVSKEYRVPPGFIPTSAAAGAEGGGITPGAAIDATATRIGARISAQEYLASLGVPTPDGSFAQYVPAGSKLIVRNTPDAIDVIDSLVDSASGQQPTQVEIESKFLEVTQNNLKELGFDWLLGPFSIGGGAFASGGTQGGGIADVGASPSTGTFPTGANFPFAGPGGIPVGGANPATGNGGFPLTAGNRTGTGNSAFSAVTSNSIDSLIASIPQGANFAAPGIFGLAGIFSNPQFQVVIRALNQKKGVDLLSAPKVTTKSGRKALVRVVREFPYPTEFNPPEPPPASSGGGTQVVVLVPGTFQSQGIVTPSTPTAFETRNLGVTLEVEPIIGPDGYTIDLNLSPEVVEFDGFINYGSPILGPIFVLPGSVGTAVLTPNTINQPIFSTRKVTTSVSIWDGQTVALGGLVREDVQKVQDKVPFLGDIPLAGRLFRSDIDQKIKRNLIIFVTARLMDAEGRPVRQDDETEEPVEPLGLPQEIPPPVIQTVRSLGK